MQNFIVVAHPQENGQVEVLKRIMVDGVKKLLEQEKTNWVDELPFVLWAYRTKPRSATGETTSVWFSGPKKLCPLKSLTSIQERMKS